MALRWARLTAWRPHNDIRRVARARDHHRPGPHGAVKHPQRFPTGHRFCVALLDGRAGRLAAQSRGVRPRQVVITKSLDGEAAEFCTQELRLGGEGGGLGWRLLAWAPVTAG